MIDEVSLTTPKETVMSVNQRVEAGQPGPNEGTAPATSGLKKIVAASMVGTVVEWYEFFLYATAASLVFGKFFFPNAGSELDGIIAAFLTYAVGFIARPLGGIVFGHIGDRLGRKHTLQVTIVLVGVATFLMGCLPGYNNIGYWAPALLATLVLLTMSWILPAEQFLSWGWRVGFWLSAVIVVIGYYIRTHVSEAPIFLEARAQAEAEKSISYGVLEVVKRYPKGILGAMGLRFAENILYYTIVSFSIVYLTVVHQYNTSQLLFALLIAHVVHFLVIPQVGRLSDKFGRKPVYLAGAVLGATWGFFAFPMFDTLNPVIIVFAITIGLCFHALMYAGQPAIMALSLI